jgi:hypothetical protein
VSDSSAPRPADAALYEDTIDLFGNPITPRRSSAAEDGLDAWRCSFCKGEYPSALGVDIIVLGPDYMLCFCSGECAETMNYAETARLHERLYELTGNNWIVVTEDQRIPDPDRASDREQYGDALEALAELFRTRPSLDQLQARERRSLAEELESWGEA